MSLTGEILNWMKEESRAVVEDLNASLNSLGCRDATSDPSSKFDGINDEVVRGVSPGLVMKIRSKTPLRVDVRGVMAKPRVMAKDALVRLGVLLVDGMLA